MPNVRSKFPALSQKVYGKSLVYLDSAATALKPVQVIDRLTHFYSLETANVHRGAHFLSDRATENFEATRKNVAQFINAKSISEIIYTKGTTEAINLVAQTYGEQYLKAGDEVLLSEMEHHSNIVPWQILAQKRKLVIKWIPVNDIGEIDLVAYAALFSKNTKLVAITHCSNVLGTVNPIKEMVRIAHENGAKVLVDAAQSVTFLKVDVQNLDCDFLAFSAHKLYGPYGLGVLFAKSELLNAIEPIFGGGAMIEKVSREGSVFLAPPYKFEPGTPNISAVIALSSAIDFINECNLNLINKHEHELTHQLVSQLAAISNVRFIGQSHTRANIVSFVVDGVHSSDLGHLLDQQGVAIRVGHHCAQPLMHRFGVNSTLRVSFGVYNNAEDVDNFMRALKKSLEMLK